MNKWHAHVDTWINHYAIGCPIIRVFAGKAPSLEKEAIDNAVRNLESLRTGRTQGIILALENHDFLMDSRALLQL